MNFFENIKRKYNSFFVESSLSRIVSGFSGENTSVGVISGFRGEYSLSQNRTRNNQLERMIRQSGYGFNKVVGKWVENEGTENEKSVYEETFLIRTSANESDKLKKDLLKWASKFNQEGVLFKPGNDKSTYFMSASGSMSSIGQLGVNSIKNHMTILTKRIETAKRKERKISKFHFESVEYPKNIASYMAEKYEK